MIRINSLLNSKQAISKLACIQTQTSRSTYTIQQFQSNGRIQTLKLQKRFTANSSRNKSTLSSPIEETAESNLHQLLLKPRRVPIPRWITPRQKTFTLSECFGHMSFVLVAASYATDDFLLLRSMAVAGSSAMLVFTYHHPHGRVLWLPFKWNALFIGINIYRIAKSLYYQHKGMNLNPEMLSLKQKYFDTMDIVDFAKLMEIAQEETFCKHDLVCYQGQKNAYVRLVIEGKLNAMRDGIKTYSLEEGNFVTESGLHAGLLLDGTIETSCTIVATSETPSRCLKWNRTELVELLKTENGLRRTFKAILSWDIVRKLKGQRDIITDHEIDDMELWTLKRKEQTDVRYAALVQNIFTLPRSEAAMKKCISELEHYRTIHHIDDQHHEMALKRIGLTLEEYKAGKKNPAAVLVDVDMDDDDSVDKEEKEYGNRNAMIAQAVVANNDTES